MKRLNNKEALIYFIIIFVGIALDQLTKLLAVKFLMPIDTFPIIKDVLHLTYAENTGMAFGLLKDQRWIFISVSTIAIIGMSIYLFLGKCESKLSALSLAIIVSGGLGNMIDRICLGYVVDFIDFTLIDFAIFNVADSFVCIGAGLLILALVLELIEEQKKLKEQNKK